MSPNSRGSGPVKTEPYFRGADHLTGYLSCVLNIKHKYFTFDFFFFLAVANA